MTERKVASTATVHASAERIFALLTDPSKHPLIDGSGTVVAPHNAATTQRLELGSTFGMDMKFGMPYRVTNKVVEYEPGRLIAWRHFVGHRWRWELNPVDANTTEVTETFDWSTTPAGPVLVLLGYPERNRKGIEATLRRLETVLADEPGTDDAE
ncbi:MAG TPA: SRPBCC family protein [Pseudonocardiaceae bacterium]